MTAYLLLLVAGFAGGVIGTVAGLASLVSYPALLAFGLPPLAANVTNTTAMTGVLAGSLVGARPELRGQGALLARLGLAAGAGGAGGAALLLLTPGSVFGRVVPVLVALGSLLLLARDRIRTVLARRTARRGVGTGPGVVPSRSVTFLVLLTGVYAGYFGAAAGVIVLAVVAAGTTLPFATANAVKTVLTGVGNVVATAAYVVLAPVSWPAVAALGLGLTLGGWCGPALGRRLPERWLRLAIGVAGLGLAGWLAVRA
ncbi:MAG: hypothetical protein JWR20_1434 [Marmoricola sp.]|nr:hypothetical protein [Marmoricola sp.]